MGIPSHERRVMVTLTLEEIAWLEGMSVRFGQTKSHVISKVIKDAKESLEVMEDVSCDSAEGELKRLMSWFWRRWNFCRPPWEK